MEKTQFIYVALEDYLNNVIGLQEASKMLNISDGYLRQLVLNGEFEAWEFKKLPKVILFYKESIEARVDKFKK